MSLRDWSVLTGRMMQKTGEDLSPEMWIMKLLLGPIDTSYDSKGGFWRVGETVRDGS